MKSGVRMEFSQLKELISSEIAAHQHLRDIRQHNYTILEALDRCNPIADTTLLDLGASIHGYALEAALTMGVRRYEGVDLDIERHWKSSSVEIVGDNSHSGRLSQMNASHLEFPADTFDRLLSISTFEHFLDPAAVLVEMHRVLRSGGVALVSFEPIWTSSYGHHLHHFGAVSRLIPPWSHLFLGESQMRNLLERQPWPAESPVTVEQALQWVYRGDGINRFDIHKLKDFFRHSLFEVVWIYDLPDEETTEKRAAAEYLSKCLPYSANELMTKGLSLLLRK